ncbi:MAG: hypothetical protein ACLUFI_01525 [Oscillospiraceae bacterium]
MISCAADVRENETIRVSFSSGSLTAAWNKYRRMRHECKIEDL